MSLGPRYNQMIDGEQPPQVPASINTRVLAAGQLLDFDEHVDTVVERLEAARVGGHPAEFRAAGRRVFVSPQAAGAWVTAFAINPRIKAAPAEAVTLLRPTGVNGR